jgi:hypothetical protein
MRYAAPLITLLIATMPFTAFGKDLMGEMNCEVKSQIITEMKKGIPTTVIGKDHRQHPNIQTVDVGDKINLFYGVEKEHFIVRLIDEKRNHSLIKHFFLNMDPSKVNQTHMSFKNRDGEDSVWFSKKFRIIRFSTFSANLRLYQHSQTNWSAIANFYGAIDAHSQTITLDCFHSKDILNQLLEIQN